MWDKQPESRPPAKIKAKTNSAESFLEATQPKANAGSQEEPPESLWHFCVGDDTWGFPGGSDGKESTCNARDPGVILCWEDPLEESMTTHSSILAWRIPMTEEPGGYRPWGHKESDTTE